jgi:hypothetical protein
MDSAPSDTAPSLAAPGAVLCDAREVISVKQVLITLVEHVRGSSPADGKVPRPAPVPQASALQV